MTGIFHCLWAPARQPHWVATPASHAALQAVLFRRVSLQGRRRCKHSAVNVIMRDGYTVLATMVAHDHISMSIVMNSRICVYTCREMRSIVDSMLS